MDDIFFQNIKALRTRGRVPREVILAIEDFIHYFTYTKDQKVKTLKLSDDRDADTGEISLCLQSIERANTLIKTLMEV